MSKQPAEQAETTVQGDDDMDTGIQDGTSIVEQTPLTQEGITVPPPPEPNTVAQQQDQSLVVEEHGVVAAVEEPAIQLVDQTMELVEQQQQHEHQQPVVENPTVPATATTEPTVTAVSAPEQQNVGDLTDPAVVACEALAETAAVAANEAVAAAAEGMAVPMEVEEDLATENERLKKEKAELVLENETLKEQVERLKAQVLALETADNGKPYSKQVLVVKTPISRGIKRSITGTAKLPTATAPAGTAGTTPTDAGVAKPKAATEPCGKRSMKWDMRFEQLEAFHKEHGHVNLSKRNATADLAIWVNDQRTQHRLLREGQYSTMTAERIQRLRSLGFQFTVTKSPPLPWEERFQQLTKYKEQHNHCNVQQLCQASPAGLGNWVLEQRRKYKLLQEGRTRGTKVGTLTQERIAKLEELGFQWKLRDRNDKRTRKSDVKLTEVEHNDVLAAAQQLANAAATAPIASSDTAAAAATTGATTAAAAAPPAVTTTTDVAVAAEADPAAAFAAEAALEGVIKQQSV